ncbi:MAG: pentapeptide repeat-containing protein [Pseudonocardiaceae bacterium]
MSEEVHYAAPFPDGRRSLRADCERCFGLCCVAPAFSASADFAVDKGAGQACHHLQSDFRCAIHSNLREQGFPGCTVYDCFGAGQKVAQVTFDGQDWRRTPGIAVQMFTVFTIMRQLHGLLWYLTEALRLPPARSLHGELSLALEETERLTRNSPDDLVELDVAAHRQDVNALLLRASELVRAEAPRRRTDRRGADLIGANLRGADLRGANLRGAYLIGADLRDADLRMADLIGVDLRGADLRGADLTESIFLTQSQLNAARGNLNTKLPPSFTRPTHWVLEAEQA